MKNNLDVRLGRGARWFYWIAALSVIQAMMAASGSFYGTVVGLGSVQALNRAAGFQTAVMAQALIVAAFAAFGYFASRRAQWAFVVGMALYALDGALFLTTRGFLPIIFHAFVLYRMFDGLMACNMLAENDVLTRNMMLRAALQKDSDARASIAPAQYEASSSGAASAAPWRPSTPTPTQSEQR